MADAHEFFADGVLVHNCDAAYYSWKDLRKGGIGTISAPGGSLPKPPVGAAPAGAPQVSVAAPGRGLASARRLR